MDNYVPVDEQTRSAAHWALYLFVVIPTIAAMLAGLVLKLLARASGGAYPGLLMWVVLIGLFQLAIVVVGRSQYLSGVSMRVEPPARAPQTDPGIFHHEPH